jgi:hypothetical protein
MPSRTIHAETRVWQRYGVAPTRRQWDEAVQHIIGRVIGEKRPAMRLRTMENGREEWIVRVAGIAVRAVYCPRGAVILTVLPKPGRQ